MDLPDKDVLDMSDEEIAVWHTKIKQYNDELAAEYKKCSYAAGKWSYSRQLGELVCDGDTAAGKRMKELEEILDSVKEWISILSDRDWIQQERQRHTLQAKLRVEGKLGWQQLANEYASEFAGDEPLNPQVKVDELYNFLDSAVINGDIINNNSIYSAITEKGKEIIKQGRDILFNLNTYKAVYPRLMTEWLDKKLLGFKLHADAVKRAIKAGEPVEKAVLNSINREFMLDTKP